MYMYKNSQYPTPSHGLVVSCCRQPGLFVACHLPPSSPGFDLPPSGDLRPTAVRRASTCQSNSQLTSGSCCLPLPPMTFARHVPPTANLRSTTFGRLTWSDQWTRPDPLYYNTPMPPYIKVVYCTVSWHTEYTEHQHNENNLCFLLFIFNEILLPKKKKKKRGR